MNSRTTDHPAPLPYEPASHVLTCNQSHGLLTIVIPATAGEARWSYLTMFLSVSALYLLAAGVQVLFGIPARHEFFGTGIGIAAMGVVCLCLALWYPPGFLRIEWNGQTLIVTHESGKRKAIRRRAWTRDEIADVMLARRMRRFGVLYVRLHDGRNRKFNTGHPIAALGGPFRALRAAMGLPTPEVSTDARFT